ADGPEARGIRRQQLINQDELCAEQPELHFRVGDDDAAVEGVLGGGSVNGDAGVGQRLTQVLADDVLHLLERDIDIVTRYRLGRWRKNRRGQLVGLAQPLG